MEEGKFREDLFARINMWTFALPGLRDRREDIEPNIDYELAKFCQDQQSQIRFDSEARNVYVKFACSSQALWRGNFRELGASISRMATFAERGRITKAVAEEEIGRLQAQWQTKSTNILPQQIGEIDLFDQPQLATVLEVCRRSSTLSEAGRELFAVSRQQKKQPNDADRLRKYLAKFGLDWDRVKADLMS